MDPIDLKGLLARGSPLDVLGGQELMVEALRELVKDEIKARIREALARDPDLNAEVRHAIGRYVEAKVLEGLAVLALAKASAKLSLDALPPNLRDRVTREVGQSIERELQQALAKL